MATATIRDAIRLANQHFMKVFGQGDAAAVARCYSADAQVLPPQAEPIAGRPGIEGFWRAVIGMGITGVTLDTVELVELGEGAVEVGRYALSVAGGQTVDHGKYVVLWRPDAGTWKLHRDIWNTSVPPAS
jgi:ketosteroid isomerase-like protein